MNLERLRSLHALAVHGSVHEAARSLHVTTSAVSQQITKLEREVNHTLIVRNGRGVRLTDAALLLVERTASVLSMMESAEGDLDELRDSIFGSIVVSGFPTAVRGLCPMLVSHLREQCPQLTVTCREHEPVDSLPLLLHGDIDVVVAQGWFNRPLALPVGLSTEFLFDDVADIAMPSDHRLAGCPIVDLDDLAADDWITWPDNAICNEWLLYTLRSRGHEPRIAHTAGEHATQLAFVAAGLGVAVMPRLGRDSVPEGVTIVEVAPQLHREVFAVWRTDAARRTAIQAVVGGLGEVSSKQRTRKEGISTIGMENA